FADRFHRELGYTFVYPFAIYDAVAGGRQMYYMIHASDHEEAPRFMARAYAAVVNRFPPPPEPSLFEAWAFRSTRRPAGATYPGGGRRVRSPRRPRCRLTSYCTARHAPARPCSRDRKSVV